MFRTHITCVIQKTPSLALEEKKPKKKTNKSLVFVFPMVKRCFSHRSHSAATRHGPNICIAIGGSHY